MLLHKNPKKVFVLGTGSGMTLGAISVHPGEEEIVLAEIEPKVIGVARTFSKYNHGVLNNPKLRIVFNDGRNYLMTTKRKFDVITADPIHPWFSGAGYLYTKEYFRLAVERLRPGGIICQWLPIYELSVDDLKCVVRTFSESFKYTMLPDRHRRGGSGKANRGSGGRRRHEEHRYGIGGRFPELYGHGDERIEGIRSGWRSQH